MSSRGAMFTLLSKIYVVGLYSLFSFCLAHESFFLEGGNSPDVSRSIPLGMALRCRIGRRLVAAPRRMVATLQGVGYL